MRMCVCVCVHAKGKRHSIDVNVVCVFGLFRVLPSDAEATAVAATMTILE